MPAIIIRRQPYVRTQCTKTRLKAGPIDNDIVQELSLWRQKLEQRDNLHKPEILQRLQEIPTTVAAVRKSKIRQVIARLGRQIKDEKISRSALELLEHWQRVEQTPNAHHGWMNP